MSRREIPKSLKGLLIVLKAASSPSEYKHLEGILIDVYQLGYAEGKEDAQLEGMFSKSFKED